MNQTPNQRGTSFEDRVEGLLANLRSSHPTVVEFEREYTVSLRTDRVVRTDFMLSVKNPNVIDVHLIECQSRRKSRHDVIDKIRAIRNDSDHNRFFFVHEAPISEAVRNEFSQHGIVVYQFNDFAAFTAETDSTLTAIAAAPNASAKSVASGPPTVPGDAPATTFQPRVEKGFGNSPGISTRAGIGNISRPGFGKGR